MSDLVPAHLFPERVRELGSDEVGRTEDEVALEKPDSSRGVNLRHVPFDRDAGVDDDLCHRRRSSAMSAALSECRRSPSLRRSRAAVARLSTMSMDAARSTMLCNSA